MDESSIIYGVQFFIIFASSTLALASVALFGSWWTDSLKKRNTKNGKLNSLSKKEKSFCLSPTQMVSLTIGFTVFYIFLTHKYIEPYIVGLILD